jgi:hypothetical protein
LFAQEDILSVFNTLCLKKLQTNPYFTYSVELKSHEKTESSIRIISYDDTLIFRTYLQLGQNTLFIDEKFTFYKERQKDAFFFPSEMNDFYQYKSQKDAEIQLIINTMFFSTFAKPVFLNMNDSPTF